RLTETAKGKPLSEREHYIEGAGQLCRECYQGLYVPRHNGNVVQIAGTLSQFWEKHSKLRKMGYKDGRDKT
ncbi:MAG TPA: hypothetical protein DDY31_10985, partial [Lachnospiraceae bacterium]|nr:hypothetical protein [Lachnospiraceae bacterium]